MIPRSPSRKQCALAVGGFDPVRGEANALSAPPGEYGRKIKTQKKLTGPAQAVEYVA